MTGMDHTLGIDLASQPASTGVCLLAWAPEGAEVLLLARGSHDRRSLDDRYLLELMCGGAAHGAGPPARIGIDAPLGWPRAFVAALTRPGSWPLEEEVAPDRLVRRATDRWVHAETGKLPLSVSTDRIAYPAMRAQRLLRRYCEQAATPVDPAGLIGPVCEVYPDPAITRYGLRGLPPRVSYKGPAGGPERARIVTALTAAAGWLVLGADQRAACIASDDVLDALICALVARSVQCGHTEGPPAGMREEAASEGWIQLPPVDGLRRLAPARL
jgi:hypothetical protein